MAERQVQLNLKENNEIFSIGENDIIRVYTGSNGTSIYWYDEGATPRQIVVTQTPAQVAALTKTLFLITPTDADTEYINANYVVDISDEGGVTTIEYNKLGAYPEFINVTETRGELLVTINALAGMTAYAIDGVSLTPDSFTLAAAHGNVTAIFTNGKVFTVTDSTGNDGTYVVASSSFGGGKTTIAIVEDVPDPTADGFILIVT